MASVVESHCSSTPLDMNISQLHLLYLHQLYFFLRMQYIEILFLKASMALSCSDSSMGVPASFSFDASCLVSWRSLVADLYSQYPQTFDLPTIIIVIQIEFDVAYLASQF